MSFLFGKPKNNEKIISNEFKDAEIGSYQPENPFSNITILPAFKSTVTQIYVFNNKKKFVVGDENGTLSIWDSKFGTKIIEIKFHNQAINSISELNLAEKSFLIASSNDKSLTIWDVCTFKLIAKTNVGPKIYKIFETSQINDFFFAASFDIKIFDYSLNVLDQFPRENRDETIRLMILIDRTKIVLATNTDIEFYALFCFDRIDLIVRKIRIKQLKIHENCHLDTISCLNFLKDNLFASGSSDGAIYIWQADAMQKLMELKPFEENDLCETFTKSDFFRVCGIIEFDRRYYIIASGLSLSVYDNESEKFIFKIMNCHNGSKITNLLALENNLLITGAENGSIRIWKFEENLDHKSVLNVNLRLVGECLGQSSSISILKTMSKKEIISAGYDNIVIIWRDSIAAEIDRKKEVTEILSTIKN